jgi:hypothetical protein
MDTSPMARAAEVEPIISDGRIFTVIFIKRTNDEERTMQARTGVRKGIKGVGLKFNPASYNLISVYDIKKRAFRFISCERIEEIHHHGVIELFPQP